MESCLLTKVTCGAKAQQQVARRLEDARDAQSAGMPRRSFLWGHGGRVAYPHHWVHAC